MNQLVKKNNLGLYSKIYPYNFTENIFDKNLDTSLDKIITKCNNIYLKFLNNIEETRLQVPSDMRRESISIGYKDSNDTIHFEYYIGKAFDDNSFRNSDNWEDVIPAIDIKDVKNKIKELVPGMLTESNNALETEILNQIINIEIPKAVNTFKEGELIEIINKKASTLITSETPKIFNRLFETALNGDITNKINFIVNEKQREFIENGVSNVINAAIDTKVPNLVTIYCAKYFDNEVEPHIINDLVKPVIIKELSKYEEDFENKITNVNSNFNEKYTTLLSKISENKSSIDSLTSKSKIVENKILKHEDAFSKYLLLTDFNKGLSKNNTELKLYIDERDNYYFKKITDSFAERLSLFKLNILEEIGDSNNVIVKKLEDNINKNSNKITEINKTININKKHFEDFINLKFNGNEAHTNEVNRLLSDQIDIIKKQSNSTSASVSDNLLSDLNQELSNVYTLLESWTMDDFLNNNDSVLDIDENKYVSDYINIDGNAPQELLGRLQLLIRIEIINMLNYYKITSPSNIKFTNGTT